MEICSSGEHRKNPKLSKPLTCIQHGMSQFPELTSCNQACSGSNIYGGSNFQKIGTHCVHVTTGKLLE